MIVYNTRTKPCPNCGGDMEPIENSADGVLFDELRLCPGCYLVTWNDETGQQFRQGVPVKTDHEPRVQAIN